MNLKNELEEFLSHIWDNYVLLTPQAEKIYNLLTEKGEKVLNDHIAFRTFSDTDFSIMVLAEKFMTYGYTLEKNYQFPAKKLTAVHLEHFDVTKPKIFISEIDVGSLSSQTKNILKKALATIPASVQSRIDLPFSGRHWNASFTDYIQIYSESEYAAWVYAHGFRPNHFTVYINELEQLNDIYKLNAYLKSVGFRLNTSGGEVKGSPGVFLEQSSTMADPVKVLFSEGAYQIPGAYYEFAKRYSLKNNKIFQGFVAESADKIFESTNKV